MYEEFIRCLSSHHHDDIPDNLGYQPMYAPQATQAMVENKTDMFYVVDRQGWGDIYNEGFSPNDGSVFTLGEDGSITPYTRTQPTRYSLGEDGRLVAIDAPNPIPVSFDDWIPEQDTKAENPYGMDNVLGTGIFG
jgi:hypothetical protein